jgi:hypothetical protein
MYPRDSINIVSLTVSPGDRISAYVNYTGSNQFALNLADATTGGSYSTIQTMSNAQRSSAEWIVEAPSSGHTLPLADFGTAKITSASASATLKGSNGTTNGPIDSVSWQNTAINMASRGTTEATTSPVADSGGTSSFSVTFDGNTSTPQLSQHHRHSNDADGIGPLMVIPLGPAPQPVFNQPVLPIITLPAPNLFAAQTPSPLTATSPALLGSSNGQGSVGVEEPNRNDSDVLPDLLPPIRRPQANPTPMQEESNQPVRPAPTAPAGELSNRENTPPPMIDPQEIKQPEVPAETRELPRSGFGKVMANLFTAVAAFALFSGWKASRTDDRESSEREPESK